MEGDVRDWVPVQQLLSLNHTLKFDTPTPQCARARLLEGCAGNIISPTHVYRETYAVDHSALTHPTPRQVAPAAAQSL